MTPDEHQRERMRVWRKASTAALTTPCPITGKFHTYGDAALAAFDAAFPAPSAAAPVEPVPVPDQSAMGMAVASLILDQTAELATLRQKARLWDAVASGKVRLNYYADGRFAAFYGSDKFTSRYPTAAEAVEAAIAAGALK